MFTTRHRPLVLSLALGLALLCFALGAWSSQLRVEQRIAENDARIADLRDQMVRNVLETRRARMPRRLGTSGDPIPEGVAAEAESRDALVGEIKRQLQSEMGLLPIRVLRERRTSFVEVHAYDQSGKMSYATAGYLGNVSEKERGARLDYDELAATTLLHGSPETVIARLRELRDTTGLTSLLLHYPPYYGHDKAMRSLRLFAERVMPEFRRA